MDEKYRYVREGNRLSIRDIRDDLEVGFIEVPEGATAEEIAKGIQDMFRREGLLIPNGEN